MRVLLIVADPLDSDLQPLNTREEWLSMARAINFQQLGVIIHQIPPTLHHLRQALINTHNQYEVVHFIGHGSPMGLYLENEMCCEDFVSATDLVAALVEADIRLVVLNVCESELPAQELVDAGVPTVIATNASIPDNYAITLAKEVYGALAAGRSVGEAVSLAQIVLQREGGQIASNMPVVIGDFTWRFGPNDDTGIENAIISHYFPKNNLRNQSGFLGRREELVRGIEYLADPDMHIIQVSGVGGIGKSSFVLELSRRSAWRFMSGVIWIEPPTDLDNFSTFLLHSMGVVLPIELTGDLEGDIQSALRILDEQQCLIIFDDIDRLSATIRDGLVSFLKRMAFTSKAILLTRAHMSELDDLGGIAHISLGGLDVTSAIRFLLRETRAKAIDELMADPEIAFSRLSRTAELVGYHPKMMQLAVGLIRHGGFDRALRTLLQLPDNILERISQLLADSFALLDENDIQVLRAMSTFEGNFKVEWADQVSGLQTQTSLGHLIDTNLVERDSVTNMYRLHALVRDYVLHSFRLDQWHIRRHAQLFAEELARIVFEQDQDRDISLAPLEKDVVSAIARLREETDQDILKLIIQLVSGIRDYLHFYRQVWTTIQTIEEISIRASRAINDELALAKSLTSLGAALAAQQDFQHAFSSCQEGIDILEKHSDQVGLCVAYGALGFIYRRKREYAESQKAYERALELAQEGQYRILVVRHLSNLGTGCDRLSDWVGAERFQREALSLADQIPLSRENLIRQRLIRNSLAKSLKNQGRLQEAADVLEQNLVSLGTERDLQEQWLLFFQLGRINRELNRFDKAFHYYKTALRITEVAGDRKGTSMCLRGLGKCYQAAGNLSAAAEHLEQAVVISEKIDDPYLSELQKDLQELLSLLPSD